MITLIIGLLVAAGILFVARMMWHLGATQDEQWTANDQGAYGLVQLGAGVMITVDRTATGAPRLTIPGLGSVGLTENELADLALAMCDLLTTGTRTADAAVLMSPGRVRERELPGLRTRRGEMLDAWLAEHGGGAA